MIFTFLEIVLITQRYFLEIIFVYVQNKRRQRSELLAKAKGYKLTETTAEGRCFEAILAGRQEIQKRTSTPMNNMNHVDQAFGNCGRAHSPRTCQVCKCSARACGMNE